MTSKNDAAQANFADSHLDETGRGIEAEGFHEDIGPGANGAKYTPSIGPSRSQRLRAGHHARISFTTRGGVKPVRRSSRPLRVKKSF